MFPTSQAEVGQLWQPGDRRGPTSRSNSIRLRQTADCEIRLMVHSTLQVFDARRPDLIISRWAIHTLQRNRSHWLKLHACSLWGFPLVPRSAWKLLRPYSVTKKRQDILVVSRNIDSELILYIYLLSRQIKQSCSRSVATPTLVLFFPDMGRNISGRRRAVGIQFHHEIVGVFSCKVPERLRLNSIRRATERGQSPSVLARSHSHGNFFAFFFFLYPFHTCLSPRPWCRVSLNFFGSAK